MRTVIENIRTGARWSTVNGDVWRKAFYRNWDKRLRREV